MSTASNPKPETNNEHPYRYSIPDLIELSSAACLPFDLSKFTYDAARAGVVPPLVKCTMSSRKSSAASRFRNSSAATAISDDLVGFMSNDIVRPSRQPSNPPAAHRQQDEGFAKFLKKHTSPNHNRVTAGGRIVPMERPSPPVFSLTSGKLSKSPAATSLRSIDVNKRVIPTHHVKSSVEDRAVQCPSYRASDREFRNPHLMMSTMDLDHSQDLTPQCFPAAPVTSPLSSSMLYDGAVGGMVHHAVRPPCHMATSQGCFANVPTHRSWTSPFPSNGAHVLPNAYGCFDVHGAGRGEAFHDMTVHAEPPLQTTSPLHQTLAQWQQHYAELEQQLKDMDRHRAMVNLDPLLVQQRCIIVQQRSDARDTIRQLKDTLGLGHSTDSSQESFNANFNVEAPVYIPQMYASQFQADHAIFTPKQTASAILHPKPQIPSGSRAVPIKAPPPIDRNVPTLSHKAPPHAGVVVPNAQPASKPLQRNPAPESVASAPSRHTILTDDGTKQFSNSSRSQRDNNANNRENAKIPASRAESHKLSKVSSEIPYDTKQEYFELLKAVSRAKGVTTSVTLVDGRKIDVEGQGLQLIRTSDTDNEDFDGSDAAVHGELANGRVQAHDPFAEYQPENCAEPRKENISVQPQAHKKSATDAFLAQFNTGKSDPAFTKHLVTQSDSGGNFAHLGMPQSTHVGYPIVSESRRAAYTNSQGDGSIADVAYHPTTQVEGAIVPRQDTIESLPSNVQSKGESSTSLQNVHAVYRPPIVDAGDAKKLNNQPHLVNADKNKSPRLLRRQTGNSRGWLGPFWRDSNDRQPSPSTSPSKNCFK